MTRSLLIFSIVTTFLATGAEAAGRVVKCQIDGAGVTSYKGQCIFTPDSGGSFSLRNVDEGKLISPNVTDVSVSIIEKDVAEVRGLTTDGINSRWGDARRSSNDPACWVGSDFRVCAW